MEIKYKDKNMKNNIIQNFSNTFKRITGLTPEQYQQKKQEMQNKKEQNSGYNSTIA